MTIKNYLILGLCVLGAGCTRKHDNGAVVHPQKPETEQQGRLIRFPDDEVTLGFFDVDTLRTENLSGEYTAPAKVSATVIPSHENVGHNLVLFDNPELTANYTAFLQHRITINRIVNVNIRQKKTELERYRDLSQHGAATGKELLEAQTELAMEETELQNEKAAIIEHETKLRLAGFDPEALVSAPAGRVWLICDVPESQVDKLNIGGECTLHFSSYPDQVFRGRIEDFGDVVDNVTRMVKMRINLPNPGGKLKAGMFAMASFTIGEGKLLSVPSSAVVAVQGKTYVFVQKNRREFERREVQTGQQINDRIVVYGGVNTGEQVVKKGAMQLKGLSFGY